jgi:ferredoxin--NADP+ reductase
MARSVAVIGSGPGGMYVVQALLKLVPDVKIDIIERLPSPFGLIRGGVAPDHYTTKNVARAFEKSIANPSVRYLGNVEVGRDVSVGELEEIYDAVVLAYGAPKDNKLGIKGEDKKNVFGSNEFVFWYNCHPDFRELNPDLNIQAAAVIGVGNVAIDVARVLAKTPAEMAMTDLADHAAACIHPSPIKDIWLFARRGPVEGAFTNVELREMGELENCAPIVKAEQIPDNPDFAGLDDRDARLKAKNVETLRSFIGAPTAGKMKRMHFEFYAAPTEILGGDKVEGIRLQRTRPIGGGRVENTGETFDVPCQMVVTCIGSRAHAIEGVPFDDKKGIVQHAQGKIRDRLYAAGWVKRGASGTIGTNKTDSDEVTATVIKNFAGAERGDGPAKLDKLLSSRGEVVRPVDWAGWQQIEKAEVAAATKPAPRRKFVRIDDMLAVLDKARATT